MGFAGVGMIAFAKAAMPASSSIADLVRLEVDALAIRRRPLAYRISKCLHVCVVDVPAC